MVEASTPQINSKNFVKEMTFIHKVTVLYTPQHNGLAEKK